MVLAFDLDMGFEDSPWSIRRCRDRCSFPCGARLTFSDDGTRMFEAKIWNPFENVGVRVGMYDTYGEAHQAYESAEEEMAEKWAKKMTEKMKALYGPAFFGKNNGSISSFQELPVLENLDGIDLCERHFGIDESAKTIEQVYDHLPALIQRNTIPVLNPSSKDSLKDYGDTLALIDGDAHLVAEIQRNSIPAPDPSLNQHPSARSIFKEKSSIAYTFTHMGRESWRDRNDLRGYLQAGNYRIYAGSGDTRTAESMKRIPSGFSYTGKESDHDPGIQNPTGEAKIIGEDSVRSILRRDLAVQPLLAKTLSFFLIYAILFLDLINANLPICQRWKFVLSATFRTLRNALKKARSKKSGGPNIVSNSLSLFKSASKLAVGMVTIGNTPAVGAVRTMAPEAIEPGSVQAADFEKSTNFVFGVVACVGTLVAIIALLKSFNWSRRHSITGASTASAPTGAILNRAVNMPQTLTVLRSWRETEYREVVVARREEEGAYAS